MIVTWEIAGAELVGVLDPEFGWKWGGPWWSWPWRPPGKA